MALGDDDTTVVEVPKGAPRPVCSECSRPANLGGRLVPSVDAIAFAMGSECAKGPMWSWCGQDRRYSLWLPR